ncbi:hypothetical protein JCM11641_003893 [Rhodosporidiobolus odoratus]
MHAPRLSLLVGLLVVAVAVKAQLETVVDADSGATVVISVATDADGDPSATSILSTLTDAAAADPAAATTTSSTTTAAVAATTDTTAADDDDTETAVGQPAQVVGQPASRCTTAGCPVKPTTYTQNGVIATWTATTPATPIPTWTSSGQVLQAASYITSVSSATGRSGGSSRFASSSFFPFGTAGDWGIMAAVAVVGGMVGAVAVL